MNPEELNIVTFKDGPCDGREARVDDGTWEEGKVSIPIEGGLVLLGGCMPFEHSLHIHLYKRKDGEPENVFFYVE